MIVLQPNTITMKIGLLRERKSPPDIRVALIPWQCKSLMEEYPGLTIVAEDYPQRSYSNDEFKAKQVTVSGDISDCDILIGIKEVPVEALIENKTYIIFSHTIKKQAHNQKLLQAVLKKNIRLIDYECLRYPDNGRIIGFGRFAGIAGAYNTIRAWGIRNHSFQIQPAHACYDLEELYHELKKVKLPAIKILLTGAGKVGNGAQEILDKIGIKEVSWESYLNDTFEEAVYTQIEFPVYNKRKDGGEFNEQEFFSHPEKYESNFHPFLAHTHIFIAGHFWSAGSPKFFNAADLASPTCKITVIGDISCDIDGPIPSTIRASTIEKPYYGFQPVTGKETGAFDSDAITVMAVDNLPCELPRDASEDFGNHLMDKIFPLLLGNDPEGIIEKATIAKDGKLTSAYAYLQDYADGK